MMVLNSLSRAEGSFGVFPHTVVTISLFADKVLKREVDDTLRN